MFNPQTNLRRASVYEAIAAAGVTGIAPSALAERFGVAPKSVRNHIDRMAKEQPPRVVRTAPAHVVAACFHPSSAGRIHTAPVRKHGIVVGSLDHKILLALRAPGGMTSEQINARFPNSPSSALSRLRAAGLVEDGGPGKEKAVWLTIKGRELIDPDGPLARRKTLNTYCQL